MHSFALKCGMCMYCSVQFYFRVITGLSSYALPHMRACVMTMVSLQDSLPTCLFNKELNQASIHQLDATASGLLIQVLIIIMLFYYRYLFIL